MSDSRRQEEDEDEGPDQSALSTDEGPNLLLLSGRNAEHQRHARVCLCARLDRPARPYTSYLLCLLRTMLILLASGRFFSGMENQVFLPMITTFCFPGTQTRARVIHPDHRTSQQLHPLQAEVLGAERSRNKDGSSPAAKPDM